MLKKVPLYADLIKVTSNTLIYLEAARIAVQVSCNDPLKASAWQAALDHFKPLIQRVIDQTQRRVFNGETVPATEKTFNFFEAHTDIIIKGSREIQCGH